MSHSARPYQQLAISAIHEALRIQQSTLAVMATGTGKSFVFSSVVKTFHPKRSLILAHRGELLFQAAKHVERTGLETSIEKAELVASASFWAQTPVVVASVPTLVSKRAGKYRMERFNPLDFGLIVCDEAHYFVAESFRRILNYFKEGNPEIKIVGVTATPDRLDQLAMGQVFETVCFEYDISPAIKDGWLVPIKVRPMHCEGLDLSHVRTTGGDLNGADLAACVEAEKPLYGVAQGTLEAAYGLPVNTLFSVPVPQWYDVLSATGRHPRSTLAFASSVKHADLLSGIFNRIMPGISGWVCGKTPQDQRDKTNNDFKAGALKILCNCGTHTVGFDCPTAEVIVPKFTKSRALMCQMIGRGTRAAEIEGRSILDQYDTPEERHSAIAGSVKPWCEALDFHGVTGRLKLARVGDVLGGKMAEEVVDRAEKNARKKNKPVDMTEELLAAQEELEKEKEEAKQRDAARKAQLVARVKITSSTIDPFDVLDLTPHREHASDSGRKLSEKQRAIMVKMGINPDTLPFHQAKQILNEQFRRWDQGLCSVKQAALLKKHGYNVKDMTMKEASAAITELKANNWHRPMVATTREPGEEG